jgi:hypothetical protein
MKCSIYNTILLEMTHFVTHMKKIKCTNVTLHNRYQTV